MSDVLGAASLFLAVIGLLYGAWYGEITEALAIEVSKFIKDRGPAITQVEAAYLGRSLPLAVSSAAIALILLHPFISIIYKAISTLAASGIDAFDSYNAVKVLFCAVYVMTVGLAVHTATLAWRLKELLKKLRAK